MKKRGFTLIETIIVIFIFSLLSAAVFSAIVILYKSQSFTFQQSMAVSEARRGID
ncbi:MAG: PulJ/GspJ family protein, partial [Minisyncoccales bacterium]